MKKISPAAQVCLIDYAKWSDKSKRSYSYYGNAKAIREYKDIPYKCWYCSSPAVFRAEDQKFQFEVRKQYVHLRRNLCPPCSRKVNDLRSTLKRMDARWLSEKSACLKDSKFLAEWLDLLDDYARYHPYHQDAARMAQLRKLIACVE